MRKTPINYIPLLYKTSIIGMFLYTAVFIILSGGEDLLLLPSCPLLIHAIIIHIVSKFISRETLVTSVNTALLLGLISIVYVGVHATLNPDPGYGGFWIVLVPFNFSVTFLGVFILSCLIIGLMETFGNRAIEKFRKNIINKFGEKAFLPLCFSLLYAALFIIILLCACIIYYEQQLNLWLVCISPFALLIVSIHIISSFISTERLRKVTFIGFLLVMSFVPYFRFNYKPISNYLMSFVPDFLYFNDYLNGNSFIFYYNIPAVFGLFSFVKFITSWRAHKFGR